MSSAVVAREHSGIQHFIAGTIYIFAGLLCFVNHGSTVRMLMTTKIFPSKTRLIHVHFAIASIGAIAGFPLSATSCIMGKWIWGSWMCQAYAFEGFLCGLSVVHLLSLMAIDRFLATSQSRFYKKIGSGHVNLACLMAWILSAVWASLPLIGYGRYDMEPQGTSCTIDWLAKDELYYTYMTCLVVLGYGGPTLVSCFCYLLTRDTSEGEGRPDNDSKRMSTSELNQISRLFFVITSFSWSGYAVVCIWSLLSPITRIPLLMTYLPPILAKLGLALSPLIYSSVTEKCSSLRDGDGKPIEESKKE